MQNFRSVREQPPGTPELLRLLRQAFGEDHVAWAGLARSGDAGAVDWLLEHTLEGTRVDIRAVVRSDALRSQVPRLTAHIDPDHLFTFEWLRPLALPGSLADVVAGGGEHGHQPHARAARDAARAFVDGLIGVHPESVLVLHSRAAWSDWFARDVWDRTWIVVDQASQAIWVLCLTGGHPPRRHPPRPS